jgi:GR25 family glycosyltransferase involved in LPS biosynthesis
MTIDYIYIIHYYKEVERKKYLEQYLPILNIPYEFRAQYNRESPEVLSDMYFNQTEENRLKKNAITTQYGKIVEIGMPLEWGEKGRAYRAVTLEHFKTYEHIINNTDYQHVLILEDDVMFKPNFLESLQTYTNTLPEDYDICYIGSGCDLRLPYHTNKILDIHPQYHSRCSDSYIIKREALKKIIDTALPFFGAIDWELNYIQALNKFNVYWVTDPKTYQGSQQGSYASTFSIL